MNNSIYNDALDCLKTMFGEDAQFREDQYEAIEAVMTKQRLLVVEKTGWGKSMVYFIATKLLRDKGKGPTILISPLVSLMRNQIENAKKLGLAAYPINAETKDDKNKVLSALKNDQCDILLIAPERLANQEDMQNIMENLSKGIGMLVVDEAHCISDWGHDFRPDYRRIVSVVNSMPPNVPVLATTATANERVVTDIVEQLGDISVLRGSLMRESLQIQVIKLDDQAERLAWLAENVPQMPGNGIIYCLTVRDTEIVAEWLQKNGIEAVAYSSRLKNRERIEDDFMNNRMKCLVATVALGMGYDKPDVRFVIHYQRPGNIVSYYQQIGRAGRDGEKAYAVLLTGKEDDAIQEYFIQSAFPTESEMKDVVSVLESDDSMTLPAIEAKVNMTHGRIESCLKYLAVENVVSVVNAGESPRIFSRTTNKWSPDEERSRRITERRYEELQDIKDYVDTKECYMGFIASKLDDKNFCECGKCSNCRGEKYFPEVANEQDISEAERFLLGRHFTIEPRKRYPNNTNIVDKMRLEKGYALCEYGDAGWGKDVQIDKYKNRFVRDEIIDASADFIRQWLNDDLHKMVVTNVPSNRNPKFVKEFVKEFAEKLARELGLQYVDSLQKIETGKHQKDLNNSNLQYSNAVQGFSVKNPVRSDVLLVDDMVDSGWTLTACGLKLKDAGAGKVYPFAIASTASQKDKNNGNQ